MADPKSAALRRAAALLEAEAGAAFPAAALLAADRGAVRLSCAVGQAGDAIWFDLASLTKALCTTVVAMRLVQRGDLDLAEEALPPVAGAPVTVRHLLCHASGLPAWLPLFRDVPGAGDRRAAILAAAAEAPRVSAGVASVYSDLGFLVLTRLLEERGGDRLDRLFSPIAADLGVEVGFRPLGEDAAVPAAACAPTRAEDAVRTLLQGIVHDDNARAMGGVAGHAGLFGTAAGVAGVAAALCDAWNDADTGPRRALGLGPDSVRRFFAPTGVPGSTWGLGWDHPAPPGAYSSAGRLWPRQGVGHLGFTGCSLWLDPPAGRWVVLLTNRVCAPTAEAAEAAKGHLKALRPALHDALMEAFGP